MRKHQKSFKKELEELLNKHSIENGSDTPDWILAHFIQNCLTAFEAATRRRDIWYDFNPWQNNEESIETTREMYE